ncbi:hypothetical protein HMPREF1548_00411 [Clostridium sp. KLE 1755]|nr:hypothetical protein HMPREF1548_00411 [Clostridium sp. KLE 1755]
MFILICIIRIHEKKTNRQLQKEKTGKGFLREKAHILWKIEERCITGRGNILYKIHNTAK